MCKISTWSKDHNIETNELINFLATIGKPGMKGSQNIPKECLKEVEEHFKVDEVPPQDQDPTKSQEGKSQQSNELAEATEKINQLSEQNEALTKELEAMRVIGKSIYVPASSVDNSVVLSGKTVVSGNMSQEEVQHLCGTDTNELDMDALIDALADRMIARKRATSVQENTETTQNGSEICEEYVFDPHPAWKYAATAAGGASLVILLAKLFGGK